MKYNVRKAGILSVFILLCLGAIAWSMPADGDGRNLKVLPKNISSDSLSMLMDEYVEALNVNCAFCHAPKDPAQPKKLDYASDAHFTKEITRTMMRMTDEMNKKYMATIGQGGAQMVTCNTCHRGQPVPQLK